MTDARLRFDAYTYSKSQYSQYRTQEEEKNVISSLFWVNHVRKFIRRKDMSEFDILKWSESILGIQNTFLIYPTTHCSNWYSNLFRILPNLPILHFDFNMHIFANSDHPKLTISNKSNRFSFDMELILMFYISFVTSHGCRKLS